MRLLGGFEVVFDGKRITEWGGQRGRTLLQFLIVRAQAVHREVLMELLWPGHSYASARNNLNVCLYGLRRAVGAPADRQLIVYRASWYRLNDALRWDVDHDQFVAACTSMAVHDRSSSWSEALEAGARGVALYAGPLFDGEPLADWFVAQRVGLHELYLGTLERIAEIDMEQGDLDAAEQSLQLLLQSDGCRESSHRLLMQCFAAHGQRDLVARQYRRCVAALRADLDIAPSPQTVDLFHQLVG